MSELSDNDSASLACNPSAIQPEQRGQQGSTAERLISAVQEISELHDGYAFRLPNETALLQTVSEFIINERLCCPFFKFTLEIEPQNGPIWLRVTGGEGVKEMIQSQFGIAT